MGFILEISLVINSTIIRQGYVWETEAVGSDFALAQSQAALHAPWGDALGSVSEASHLELSRNAAE